MKDNLKICFFLRFFKIKKVLLMSFFFFYLSLHLFCHDCCRFSVSTLCIKYTTHAFVCVYKITFVINDLLWQHIIDWCSVSTTLNLCINVYYYKLLFVGWLLLLLLWLESTASSWSSRWRIIIGIIKHSYMPYFGWSSKNKRNKHLHTECDLQAPLKWDRSTLHSVRIFIKHFGIAITAEIITFDMVLPWSAQFAFI